MFCKLKSLVTKTVPINKDQDSDNEDPDCVKCNRPISDNNWYICTDPVCVETENNDFCNLKCSHDHPHQDQISLFTYHEDASSYCSCCGNVFKHNSNIYKCKVCDIYEICTTCLNKGYHGKHKEFLDKSTRKKLLATKT